MSAKGVAQGGVGVVTTCSHVAGRELLPHTLPLMTDCIQKRRGCIFSQHMIKIMNVNYSVFAMFVVHDSDTTASWSSVD